MINQPQEFIIRLLDSAGQPIEVVAFDFMHQPTRLASDRNQIKPTARGEMSAVASDAGHPLGDGIRTLEIVQQPPIKTLFTQGLLDSADVDGHRTSSITGSGVRFQVSGRYRSS